MNQTHSKVTPGLLIDLESRGLVHEYSDPSLGRMLDSAPMTLYCGFDPTADSLHAGHLIPLLTLARFQKYGHHPIVVMGGGTGMIGDPSGKSEERNLLDLETLQHNLSSQRPQFANILDFNAEENPALIVNNYDWLTDLDLLGFLRDIGKHLPMSIMLSRESVHRRMASKTGLSFTEFTYQAIQAYDFYHLYITADCHLQVGASDQYGNILAGIDLIRRMEGSENPASALVFPLLTTSAGQKMGKTARGAIWLDPKKTSPFDWYQYWLNTSDADVVRYLHMLTMIELDEIDDIVEHGSADPEKRLAQRTLAFELTSMVHGKQTAENAKVASENVFGSSTGTVDDKGEAPITTISRTLVAEGLPMSKALVGAGLATSNAEAKRLIRQGGVYLDHIRLSPDKLVLLEADFDHKGLALLAVGSRNRAVLQITEG